MRISFYSLILETTRRCNMACSHCLRGDAQELDMTEEMLPLILRDVASIDNLTFSGGEPSLNVPFIRQTLNFCRSHKIPVYGFYLVTNGKKVTDDFLTCLVEWYSYCIGCGGEAELCGVALSKDTFHEDIPRENEWKLRAFSFFRAEDKATDFTNTALINEGRALELPNTVWKKRGLTSSPLEASFDKDTDTIFVESDLYIGANGSVKTYCDSAFDNDTYTIGNLHEEALTDIILENMDKKISA